MTKRMQRMRTGEQVLLHVLVPIIAGIAIYLLWRSRSLLVFVWVARVHLTQLVDSLRVSTHPIGEAMPAWVLFSLPDALWVYALTATYIILWRGHSLKALLFWSSLGVLLAISGELGQGLGVVTGTFCVQDLTLCTLAWILAFVLVNKKRRKQSV